MAAYEYEALDQAGRRKKGVITADTLRQARKELRAKKLVPVKVEEASARPAAASLKGLPLPTFQRRIPARDLALVTRQLATLVNAAAPVEEALQAIALQSEKPAVRKALFAVRTGVMEGQRLSQAMTQQPGVFNQLYRAMVSAGEGSGTLGPVLERLADHLEKGQAMRAKVTAALVYPALLAVVAVGVVIFLMTYLVPKVVEQFATMGRELPPLTQFMITLADGFQAYGLYAGIGLAVGAVAFARGLAHRGFARRVDRVVMALPVVGKLARELQAARLARTLAALVSSGAPVLDGMQAAKATLNSPVMQDAIGDAITQVREGAPLSAGLRKTKAFPPLVVYMAAMGEKSGSLDVMLSKAADYMEAEFESLTSAFLSLVEPVIIMFMAGAVGTIVLAILLPILQFNSAAML